MVGMGVFRLFIGIWAGLNAVDDIGVLFRVVRLGIALLPGTADPTTMCNVCPDPSIHAHNSRVRAHVARRVALTGV